MPIPGQRPPFDPSPLASWPAPERDFVVALIRRQEREGWTDVRLVHELGISLGLWRKVRAGSRNLGPKLLSAAADMVSYELTTAAYNSIFRSAKNRWNRARDNGEAA